MADVGSKRKKARLILWGIAALLSLVSFWFLITNYMSFQEATVSSEQTAVAQSKNYRFYVQEYKTTKTALDEALKELEVANAQLALTRDELASVQAVNDELKANIAVLERYKAKAAAKGEALETMITSFKSMNRDLERELQVVRKELAVFQPDINDVQEGRSKIKLFKNHIRLVKKNMGALGQKAEEARKAAQKERDRVEMLYGNNGYLVKDGQNKSVSKPRDKGVQIDVRFVNP